MADTQSRSNTVKVTMNFTDGDTRTISLADPISQEDLPAKLGVLQTALSETNAFIGDRTGAAFSHLSDAKLLKSVETTLDLS